jgi:hypothetical protein
MKRMVRVMLVNRGSENRGRARDAEREKHDGRKRDETSHGIRSSASRRLNIAGADQADRTPANRPIAIPVVSGHTGVFSTLGWARGIAANGSGLPPPATGRVV